MRKNLMLLTDAGLKREVDRCVNRVKNLREAFDPDSEYDQGAMRRAQQDLRDAKVEETIRKIRDVTGLNYYEARRLCNLESDRPWQPVEATVED